MEDKGKIAGGEGTLLTSRDATLRRWLDVAGLALLAFFLHNQLLHSVTVSLDAISAQISYPVSFVYFFLMLVVALAFSRVKAGAMQVIFRSRRFMVITGAVGALGVLVVLLATFQTLAGALLMGVAIAFVSLFTVYHLLFWTTRIAHFSALPLLDGLVALAAAYVLTVLVAFFDILSVWLVAVVALASACLGFATLRLQSEPAAGDERPARDWSRPLWGVALAFVFLGIVLIDFYNESSMANTPDSRYLLYVADLVICLVALAITKLGGAERQGSSLIAVFGLYAMSLVAAILAAIILSFSGLAYGQLALIAGRNLFEGFVLLLVVACPKPTAAQTSRQSLLVIAVGIALPHVVSAATRYAGFGSAGQQADFTQLFAVTVLGSLVVGALATGVLVFAASKALHDAMSATREADKAREAMQDAQAAAANAALSLEKMRSDGEEAVTQAAVGAAVEAWNLSPREAEVLELAYKSYSAKRIAEELFIGPGTVNTHIKRIYRKASVHSRDELIEAMDSLR